MRNILIFSDEFDSRNLHEWFQDYWWLCCALSAVYVVVIFSGRAWMNSREKFDLRLPLVVWSGALAVFSIGAAVVTFQDTIEVTVESGWHGSVCDRKFDGNVGFWIWLITASKAVELGDTVFIVLRKQKLIFLHWYHHIATLVYGWYSYRDQVAPMHYFGTINMVVHSIMYSYYALRATRLVRIPRQVNVSITLLQLVQMVIGCAVNVYALVQVTADNACHTTVENSVFSLVMYFSYFILFGNFFYQSYLAKPKKPKLF